MTKNSSADANSMDPLHSKIVNIIQYNTRMRKEVARVSQRSEDRKNFEFVSLHLKRIVRSTENVMSKVLRKIEDIGLSRNMPTWA
jgi:hypothetical protein